MPPATRSSLALLLLAIARAGRADEAPPPAEQPPAPAPEARWEGAIGLNVSSSADFQGAAGRRFKATPGFFLRYGRYTVTNAGGFVTRRADDVMRGLGVDLSRNDRLRVGVALRYDGGRSESTSDALQGLGDVKPTLRVRATATYRIDDGWRLGGSWSIDAFGRGGGSYADLTVARDHRFSPATVWTWGGTLTYAGDRYMQSYFGITPEQSARSVYPVYDPASGWRDATLFTNFRTDLSADWLLLAGASRSRLVGPAAASPLTKSRDSWGLNAGLAWRF